MMKQQFIKEEVWLLSTFGAFQRANIYLPEVTEKEKTAFRKALQQFINDKLVPVYQSAVTEEVHISNIETLSMFSFGFKEILKNEQLNFGVSQKLLNLYLKYLWCLDSIPTPPHFPVDRIIQTKLGIKNIEAWTQFESAAPYMDVVNKAKEVLKNTEYTSLAQLELEIFRRNV